jgi:hypothetical protein
MNKNVATLILNAEMTLTKLELELNELPSKGFGEIYTSMRIDHINKETNDLIDALKWLGEQ